MTDPARTLAVSVPGVLLLNAAWLVPFAAGYRVGYETLNQLFSLSALQEHSLNWFQSLLGLGREIGYFNFTGAETWYSYPWLPRWRYYAIAASIPLLALAALCWHRDRRTVFLVLAAVIATMAGPGIRPPSAGFICGPRSTSRCSATSATPTAGSFPGPRVRATGRPGHPALAAGRRRQDGVPVSRGGPPRREWGPASLLVSRSLS